MSNVCLTMVSIASNQAHLNISEISISQKYI